MILVGLCRFCSRTQSIKEVKAALDAEYPAMVAAGTIAKWVPVTIKDVGVSLVCSGGRNFMIRLTVDVKLTLISS